MVYSKNTTNWNVFGIADVCASVAGVVGNSELKHIDVNIVCEFSEIHYFYCSRTPALHMAVDNHPNHLGSKPNRIK